VSTDDVAVSLERLTYFRSQIPPVMPIDRRRLQTDLLALGLLAVTVFVGLSLLSYDSADPPAKIVHPERLVPTNWAGAAGAWVAHHLRSAFGLGAWLLFATMVVLDARWMTRRTFADPMFRAFGWLLGFVSICVTLQASVPGLSSGPIIGSGGYLGAWGLELCRQHLSTGGTAVLLLTMLVAGVLLATDLTLVRLVSLAVAGPYVLFHVMSFGRDGKSKKSRTAAEPLQVRESEPDLEVPVVHVVSRTPDLDTPVPEGLKRPAGDLRSATWQGFPTQPQRSNEFDESSPLPDENAVAADDDAASAEFADELSDMSAELHPGEAIRVNPPVTSAVRWVTNGNTLRRDEAEPGEFRLPDRNVLEDAEDFPYEYLAEKARIAAATLEKTFQEFGLNVKVVEIDTGPVITQFELELEAGLRLSKVTGLADDLAIALRVPSVRVVAPIPGKNTVGVEVPNDKQVMVRLKELLEARSDAAEKMRIPMFLGKDVSGRPLVVDLAKMPHLLIAGRTGTGKSVCLNTLILSILMTRTPDQIKMLMIDPKMVELSPYKRVPHLMHPVITDMKKAEAVLAWAVDKMEERYDLLARCGVRHLDSYNELPLDEKLRRLGIDPANAEDDEAARVPEKMPYIVIVADEMADMMMTSGKEVEGHIIRLAQKSRAVGIHLVLATQKPTVDVITGLIKSNLPARISFQVASRMDSRVVLDEMGAERLLGNGDMLYLAPGTSKITRAQGTFVSDNEVNEIIDFYRDYEPQYSRELATVGPKAGGNSGIDAIRARDDLYEQAIDIVVREGRGSTSLLQRALGIGYGRAARLIDYMAEDGIVGDYNGSQARDVLYTPEQWAEIVAGRELEDAAV
jgi:S-DNA-T family DNA segregation ATPase FtsK/SpoIIIE